MKVSYKATIELTVELDIHDSKLESGLKPEDIHKQFAQRILEHLPNVDDEEGTTRTVIVSSTTIVDGKEVI